MDVSARYRSAIKRHLEFPGLHNFKTVYHDPSSGQAYAAVGRKDGTYFYLRSERQAGMLYFCRYGNTTEPVLNPSRAMLNALETATPVPLTSMWGVMDRRKLVELYWFEGRIALSKKPGAPRILSVVSRERTENNLLNLMAQPQGQLNMPTFWRLVGNKKLVPVRRELQSIGSVDLCNFSMSGRPATGVGVGNTLLLHPEIWRAAPDTTRDNAVMVQPVPLTLD